jgi:outer membrane murein-binding lipoprotein Lpp
MLRTRAVLLVLVASTGLLLSGCIGPWGPISMSKSVDIIYQVDFSQSQSVQDFDDSEYTFGEDSDGDGPKWMATFHQLLKDHGIEPWKYSPRETDGCTGGITTTAHMLYHGAGQDTMVIDGCAAEDGSFEADATAFFTQYREAHHSEEGFANADIVALTFSQSQALPDFDTSEYTQDYPQAVARFAALLDEYLIVWSEGVDPSLLGEPCPGSITTQITAVYEGTDIVVGPVEVGGCSDTAFVDEVSTLFSGWRQALAQ